VYLRTRFCQPCSADHLIADSTRSQQFGFLAQARRELGEAFFKRESLIETTPNDHDALLSFPEKAGALPSVLITDKCQVPVRDESLTHV
jgi:hypothetical protein